MMISCGPWLSGRDVLLFIDNTSAMHSFVKGISTNDALTRSVFIVHLLAYHYKFRVWYEFVPSSQNWADGVSRLGAADPWAKVNAFPVSQGAVPLWPWRGTFHGCKVTIAGD